MHNSDWFTGKPEDKIISWRSFREKLNDWPDDLSKVAQMWAKAPLTNHYLTNDHTKWPGPWVLINEGIYCDFARALGIYYTLSLSSLPNKQDIRIEYYNLSNKSEELMLVVYGDLVLNYDLGKVVNISELNLPSPTTVITIKI
jgi:hypothetical protein